MRLAQGAGQDLGGDHPNRERELMLMPSLQLGRRGLPVRLRRPSLLQMLSGSRGPTSIRH